MHIATFISVVLLSTLASACPDLAGIYTCTEYGLPVNLRVQQELNEGVTVYSLINDLDPSDAIEIVPDNERYESNEDGLYYWTQSVCQGENLLREFSIEDKHYGTAREGTDTFVLDQYSNFSFNSAGHFIVDGLRFPFNETINCARK